MSEGELLVESMPPPELVANSSSEEEGICHGGIQAMLLRQSDSEMKDTRVLVMNPYQSPRPIDVSPIGQSLRLSGHRRAAWLLFLLTVMTVVLLTRLTKDIASMALWWRCLNVTKAADSEWPMQALATLVPVEHLMTYSFSPLFLTISIVFLMWVFRAYRNLSALLPGSVTYSARWAVGYYFIPVVNLFRPYQVMREIWWKSDPSSLSVFGKESCATKTSSAAIVGWWWASFLLMHIVNYTGLPLRNLIVAGPLRGDVLHHPFVTGWVSVAFSLTSLVATVSTILLVHRIDVNQTRRYALILQESGGDKRTVAHIDEDGMLR
jgi:hypothetical protein